MSYSGFGRWARSLTHLPLVLLMLTGQTVYAQAEPQTQTPRVIAGFGSSVCDGYGDHLDRGGYIGRLEALLDDRGWQVLDVSRGGDNTLSIRERWEPTSEPTARPVGPDRYLLPHHPGYVILGLSLGNEGIKTIDAQQREKIYNQFRDGMLDLVKRCREAGMTPVVVNCYAREDFDQAEYDATRRMNLLINSWDVPSVNVLGAIDDGHGRWAPGFFHDAWHPSGGGYDEMFLAFVPSLFDAILAGKPIPTLAAGVGCAHIEASDRPVLQFKPDDPIHAFSAVFAFKTEADGMLAMVEGIDGKLETKTQRFGMSSRVMPTDVRFSASIGIEDGSLVYRGTNGAVVLSPEAVSDGRWRQVAITHRAAAGQTLIYLDGRLVSTVNERLIPDTFSLGGGAAFDARDWFIYRSALSAYEAAALAEGKMIQSSLEVYAPLRDEVFTVGKPIENRAQSLSEVTVVSDGIACQAQPIETR